MMRAEPSDSASSFSIKRTWQRVAAACSFCRRPTRGGVSMRAARHWQLVRRAGMVAVVLLLSAVIVLSAPASAMQVAASTNPVLSILPPGENGLVNPIRLLLAQIGQRPAGSDDELAPYAGLLYAGGALNDQTLTTYFHPETLSVAPADVSRVETL